MPDPGGQWPPRSISLRLFSLLKLCQLLEKVESRDAPAPTTSLPPHLLTTPSGQRRAARQASILNSLDRFRLVILQGLSISPHYETGI